MYEKPHMDSRTEPTKPKKNQLVFVGITKAEEVRFRMNNTHTESKHGQTLLNVLANHKTVR